MTAFSTDCRLTAEVLAAWPSRAIPGLVSLLRHDRRLLLVGEGSSQLMPGGFLRFCARTWNWPAPIDAVGGRAADRLDLTGSSVVCLSNSGRSREVVEAMPRLPADAFALVCIPGGALTRLHHHVLLPRAEAAIPATASVLATCLALAHALAEACGQEVPLAALREGINVQLAQTPPLPERVPRVFWLGGLDGSTSELALKTMEMTGLAGFDLPGSLGLHGIHELLEPGDLVAAADIAPCDVEELRRRVETQCGATLLIAPLPDLGVWTPLLRLVHGWRLLATIAAQMGRDPAKPRRVEKVGNHVL